MACADKFDRCEEDCWHHAPNAHGPLPLPLPASPAPIHCLPFAAYWKGRTCLCTWELCNAASPTRLSALLASALLCAFLVSR